jgi:hypothetical protein
MTNQRERCIVAPACWLVPGKVFSLWELMERINADELVAFAGRLSDLDTATWLRKEPPLSTEECRQLHEQVDDLVRIVVRVG